MLIQFCKQDPATVRVQNSGKSQQFACARGKSSHKMYSTKPQSQQKLHHIYVGPTTIFKQHYRNHTASFRHQICKTNKTELSKHILTLKDSSKPLP